MKRYLGIFGLMTMMVLLLAAPAEAAFHAQPAAPNGQTDTTTVPDVTGLTVPQAAAVLNANGLQLGQQIDGVWSVTAATPPDVVGEQSVAIGDVVAVGTVIDLTILRVPNALLIFDDNDITLVNQSGQDADLAGLRFTSLDGEPQASFLATDWNTNSLRPNRCAQLWSVGRNGPKGLEECQFIQAWRSITNTEAHFWTGANGATQFRVSQDGVSRAVCTIADFRCAFYVSVPTAEVSTPYVYFAYATDRLIVYNNTDTVWMPLAGIQILNRAIISEGLVLPLADDAAVFGGPPIVGDLVRLAPQQCLLFVTAATISRPPLPCTVIATATIPPNNAFWTANFDVISTTDGQAHTCPAASANNLSLCVMPR